MTGLGTVLHRFIRCQVSGPACRCSPPVPDQASGNPEPEPERWQAPDLFGPALSELRAALACYDLVYEIVRADGDALTERDHRTHVFAGWALARAAGRAERTYHREVERGTS